MKEFKIRCSRLSDIMSGEVGLTEKQIERKKELGDRSDGVGKPLTANMQNELSDLIFKEANPELPTGAKTYVKTWLKSNLFNKRDKEWKAIVVDKGLMCELDGIKLVEEVYNLKDVFKNDEFFENDFMQGTPDIINDGMIRDTKISWDLFTFPMFDQDIPKNEYWWQLQGYMILTGLEKSSIDYCLIDTPKSLVMLDLKKLYFQSGGIEEDWTPEKYQALYPNYRFDDIPKDKRVKSFEFDLDLSLEAKIKERVIMCRKYIETILK